MSKCRGCGADTVNDHYEAEGVGPMHTRCEIKRLQGLLDEALDPPPTSISPTSRTSTMPDDPLIDLCVQTGRVHTQPGSIYHLQVELNCQTSEVLGNFSVSQLFAYIKSQPAGVQILRRRLEEAENDA